jgi:hypothetical protein
MFLNLISDSSGALPPMKTGNNHPAIQCKIDELYYGDFLAVRDSHIAVKSKKNHGLHRSIRMRQKHGP